MQGALLTTVIFSVLPKLATLGFRVPNIRLSSCFFVKILRENIFHLHIWSIVLKIDVDSQTRLENSKMTPKSAFSPYNGQKGKGKNFGSTTLRVPESSLTSVLTKPVVA